jgi:hypothetical protein
VDQIELPAPRSAPADAAEPGSGSSPGMQKPTPAEERLFRDFEASQRRQKLDTKGRRKIDDENRQRLDDEKLFRDFQKSQRPRG